jgi:hypothetical protein
MLIIKVKWVTAPPPLISKHEPCDSYMKDVVFKPMPSRDQGHHQERGPAELIRVEGNAFNLISMGIPPHLGKNWSER